MVKRIINSFIQIGSTYLSAILLNYDLLPVNECVAQKM